MKKTIILAGALMVSAAMPAFANDNWKDLSASEREAKVQEKFNEMDTDRNGALSSAEFQAAGKSNEAFSAADSNKNGSVSLAELKNWKEAPWRESNASGANERMREGSPTKTAH